MIKRTNDKDQVGIWEKDDAGKWHNLLTANIVTLPTIPSDVPIRMDSNMDPMMIWGGPIGGIL